MASTTTNNGQYIPGTPFSGSYAGGQNSVGVCNGSSGTTTAFPGTTPGFFGTPTGFNPFFGQGFGPTPGVTNGFGYPTFGAPTFGTPTAGYPTTGYPTLGFPFYGVPTFNPATSVNPYQALAAFTGQFNPYFYPQANQFGYPLTNSSINAFVNSFTNPYTNPFVNVYANQYAFQAPGFNTSVNAWTPWSNSAWNAFAQGWNTTPWSTYTPTSPFNGFNTASSWASTPNATNPFFGAFGAAPAGFNTPWSNSNHVGSIFQTPWAQGSTPSTGVAPFGGVPTFVSPTGWPSAWSNPFSGVFNAIGTTGTFPVLGACPVTGDCACPPGVCFGQTPGFSTTNALTPGFNPGVPTFGIGSNYGYTQPYGWNQFNWGNSPWSTNAQYPGAWTTHGVNAGTWNTLGTAWNGFLPTNPATPTQSLAAAFGTRPFGPSFSGTNGLGALGTASWPFGYGYPYALSPSPAYLANFAGGVHSAYVFPYATNPNNAFIPGTTTGQGTIAGVTGNPSTVGTVSPTGAALAGCCRAAA